VPLVTFGGCSEGLSCPVKIILSRAWASGEDFYLRKMHANSMHCISKEAYFAFVELKTFGMSDNEIKCYARLRVDTV